MKNEKGITLISLVIIIIVMLIIVGITTYSGRETIDSSKKLAFISEMEIIQGKVNIIYEKMQLNEKEKEYYDNLGQEISIIGTDKISTILKGSSSEGFRYFSKENLKEVDMQNVNQNVIINFNTREVISVDGIEIEGIMYYKLKDIPNYTGYNVDYVGKNIQAPNFNVDIIELENSWKIILRDITYDNNVEGGTVNYKLHNDTNWIIAKGFNFEVDKPGLYDIKLTDKAGKSTVIQKFINYGYIANGVIAYYDAENNTGDGHNSTTAIWKDLSGNNNDATLTGFNNTSSSGWQENCIQTDGDNDTISFPVKIDKAGTFSIELVFKEKNQQKIRNFTCR